MKNKISIWLTIAAIISVCALAITSYANNKPAVNTKQTETTATENNSAPRLISKLKKSKSNNPAESFRKPSSNNSNTADKSSSQNSGSSGNADSGGPQIIKQTTNVPVNQLITVNLDIDTGKNVYSYNVSVVNNSSVYDVLKTASQKANFSLKITNYSYGVFVEEIHGVANSPSEAKYWLYYINSKLANQGASAQKVKEGDKILWKYGKT